MAPLIDRSAPDWQPPTELRCIGGPADGKWFAVPPAGYTRTEMRGGAVWLYAGPYGHLNWIPTDPVRLPRSALPCESGPEPKP